MTYDNPQTMNCRECTGAGANNGVHPNNIKPVQKNGGKKKKLDSTSLFMYHQEQYTSPVASFFDRFNKITKRALSYTSYLTAHIENKYPDLRSNQDTIAVDIGCGTGWLPPRLSNMGFSTVYGIDTSPSMLGIAFENTAQDLTDNGKVIYRTEAPAEIIGKCKTITAVHMLYHFPTEEKLLKEFFEPVSAMLEEGGELIIIACPSDFIRNTPWHYYNSVHKDDIPADTKRKSTALDVFADIDGYIPLKKIPEFKLKDGTQMKVTFQIPCGEKAKETLSLKDTFWSDAKIREVAKQAGLTETKSVNLSYEEHENAYRIVQMIKLPKKSLAL